MKFSTALSIAAFAASFALPTPAMAQSLSSGDYEQCSVYDRDGDFSGYDSVCLERKRTQISRLRERQSRYNPPVPTRSIYCPQIANLGAGYLTTWWSNGGLPPYASAYDAPVNGRPCVPNQVRILRGVP
ncbi:hypothetical protein INR77_00295 [Erythrobacter sp. SCSIO 43205]|uniref:hypothetical protein n=1 Tax=Erythrobacter sp. SCSIO 43205 TaxID=2779361 RepID=UPI001CA97EEF|nr:hypothetical protein [Erythrobacter sp. SCSIO 43205]UAB78234.1 hypothetical protein INR77_00295 [Erythrobacter sp. SCSIO 43205]